MNFIRHSVASLSVALTCFPALAEVTGGQIELSHSAFVDDTSFAKSTVSGTVELSFGPRFGAQFDVGANVLNLAEETATNFAAHAILKPSEGTALGVFFGLDAIAGESQSFYGVEIAHNFDVGGVQAYIAHGEDLGFSGTVVGLSGGTIIENGVGISASVDYASFDGGASATRFGVRGSIGQGERSKLFVEIGALNGSLSGVGSDSETYAKIGATYNFGENSGLTFGDRSIFNLLPGL